MFGLIIYFLEHFCFREEHNLPDCRHWIKREPDKPGNSFTSITSDNSFAESSIFLRVKYRQANNYLRDLHVFYILTS